MSITPFHFFASPIMITIAVCKRNLFHRKPFPKLKQVFAISLFQRVHSCRALLAMLVWKFICLVLADHLADKNRSNFFHLHQTRTPTVIFLPGVLEIVGV